MRAPRSKCISSVARSRQELLLRLILAKHSRPTNRFLPHGEQNRLVRTVANNRLNRQSRFASRAKCCQNASPRLLHASPRAMVVWTHIPRVATKLQRPPQGRYSAEDPISERSVPALRDNRPMKRTIAFLALATVVLGTSGCGCCRDAFAKKTQPVTYAQCVPQPQMCAPVCQPACVPCDPCGQPMTAGYGGTSSMMTMPQSMPMMAPSDCGCVQ